MTDPSTCDDVLPAIVTSRPRTEIEADLEAMRRRINAPGPDRSHRLVTMPSLWTRWRELEAELERAKVAEGMTYRRHEDVVVEIRRESRSTGFSMSALLTGSRAR
jgi:hypothetical protein